MPYPVLRALCRAIGSRLLRWRLGPRTRRNLEASYGDAMTDERREQLVSEVCDGFGGLPAELLHYSQIGPRFLERHLDDRDARRVVADFEAEWSGGWIAVTGHIGNWEIASQWLHETISRPMAGILVKRQPNPHLNRVIEDIRRRHGMNTLYTDEPSSTLVRLLRSGHAVGLAGDQDVVDLTGVFLDFLGPPAYTPLGPARLALAARVPLMVGITLRTERGFRMQMNPPIMPDFSAPKREEVVRLTRAWSAEIEAVIREHPGQWAWFHRRWKTTPERLERRQRRGLAE